MTPLHTLLHYASAPVDFDPHRSYHPDMPHGYAKPVGLWVSVAGEDDWAAWNKGERDHDLSDEHVYKVTLTPNANVHWICTPDGIDAFHEAYSYEDEHSARMAADHVFNYPPRHGVHTFAFRQRPVDWAKVAADYAGLIIAPYQWSRRLDGPMWYYGWDCASGCIWDLSVIASFEGG